MTKTSPDDLLDALGSLKPDADELANAWYIGRRVQTLQQVLTLARETDPESAETTVVVAPWHHPKRAIVASVVAVAMLGGGAAWAYTKYAAWYAGGALDGLTCMTGWATPGDAAHADEQYGGPAMTADPIADCNSYADLTGKARIVDPVAARWKDWLVVGPRAGMPADAVPIEGAGDARIAELQTSFDDYVDGGLSRCLDETTGTQFAHSELDRLGLRGWTVTTREQEPRSGRCALVLMTEPGAVEVRTHFGSNPNPAADLVAELRSQVAEQCLSLAGAEKVVAGALEAAHHWPTSVQLDPGTDCTRVDLNIGGSLQVFLYGPETARR